MFMDDLPIWGFIGKVERVAEEEKYSLFTHIHFDIQYNGDRVIQVDISTGAHTLEAGSNGMTRTVGGQSGRE